MKSIIFLALSFVIIVVSYVHGQDLSVSVISGEIVAKDTVDPYMSVTVCNQKKKTPTINSSKSPVWNWTQQFTDVDDNCRMKFHLFNKKSFKDESIGEFVTTVEEFLKGGDEERTISLGKNGESKVAMKIAYV